MARRPSMSPGGNVARRPSMSPGGLGSIYFMQDAGRPGIVPEIDELDSILLPPEVEEGCMFPPCTIDIIDEDTGIVLKEADVIISSKLNGGAIRNVARSQSQVIANKAKMGTLQEQSQQKSAAVMNLGTRRVLSGQECEEVVGMTLSAVLAGYRPAGEGFDAMGRPLEATVVLTQDVLQRGKITICLIMNTVVQIRIIDVSTRDEMQEDFKIPTRLFSRPPVTCFTPEAFAEASSLVGGVGGKRATAAVAPKCGNGCRAPISDGEMVYVLSCGHVFHQPCFRRILSMVTRNCSRCDKPPPLNCPSCGVPLVNKEIVLDCNSGQLIELPSVSNNQRHIAFEQPTQKHDDSEWEMLGVTVRRFVFNPATGVHDVMGVSKYDADEAANRIKLEAQDWPLPKGPLEVLVNCRKKHKEEDFE